MLCGSSDSPTWKRGCASFSRRTTSRPRSARSAAAVVPPGPPPITSTSHGVASAALGSAVIPTLPQGSPAKLYLETPGWQGLYWAVGGRTLGAVDAAGCACCDREWGQVPYARRRRFGRRQG